MKPRIGARDRLRGPSRLTDVHDKRQRAPQLLTTRSNAPSRKSASVMILSHQTSECRFHRRDRKWLHVPASTEWPTIGSRPIAPCTDWSTALRARNWGHSWLAASSPKSWNVHQLRERLRQHILAADSQELGIGGVTWVVADRLHSIHSLARTAAPITKWSRSKLGLRQPIARSPAKSAVARLLAERGSSC